MGLDGKVKGEIAMETTRLSELGFDPVIFALAIFEHSDLAIFLVYVHGANDFTYGGLNPTHEKLTGLRSEEIRGKHPHDFLPPDLADVIVAHYEECRQQQTTIWYEETIPFDGVDTFWITRLIPIMDVDGRVVQIIGASINISERKDIEQKLLQLIEFNQRIIDVSQMGIMVFDREGYCLSLNETAQRIFGVESRDTFLSRRFEDLHPRHAERWNTLWEKRQVFPEVSFVNLKGETKWVILQSFPYHHLGRDVLIVSVTDITTVKQQQKELEEKNELILALLRHLPYPIAAFREDGVMCFHNDPFATEICPFEPQNGQTTIQEVKQALAIPEGVLYPERKGREITELTIKHKKTRHYRLEQYRIGEFGSEFYQILLSFQDITAHHKLIHSLKRELHRDFLTGLYNRRGMEEILPIEWKRSQREKTSVALLMLDIDFFKNYNDSLGHAAGDRCLREVAEVLREACYRPGDFIFRYGGEEFLILLTNTKREGVSIVARRIQEHLEKKSIPHPASKVASYVTVSIGVSVPDIARVGWEEGVKQADAALYQAKQNGRKRIEVFEG